ncbi:MAG: DivIVA domain-containing protein [Acidimicrobiales bacterium]
MSVGSDKLRLLRQIPTVKFEEEMRGYSKSQVDRVLETLAPLADEIETLQQQLAEANERADEATHRASAIAGQAMGADQAVTAQAPDGDFDQTLRNTLLLAQRTADQTIREAERKAEEVRRDSTGQADSIMAGARAEAKELKGEAHAQREQMLADAESERAQLLADALEHAETRKAAIEEELLSEQGIRRNELLVEISTLERSRDDLSADVHRFEQFLEGRRESVRSALNELNAVLDDPELLAETDAPEPAEIGLLDPEELTTLSIDSHSIGTLSSEVDAAQQQAAEFAFTEPEPEPEPEPDRDVDADLGDDLDTDEVDEPGTSMFGLDASEHDADLDPSTPGFEHATPAEEFAAAIDSNQSFAGPADEGTEAAVVSADPDGSVPPAEDWQHFGSENGTMPDPAVGENPFTTGGYVDPDTGSGIAASVTPDSVFSSVPETADPAAYSDLSAEAEQPVSDPEGLGIDVESPFAEESGSDESQAGLGGLAEQARSRLASRVSRLRDTAVPEAVDAPPVDTGSADMPAPIFQSEPTMDTAVSPFEESVPPPPVFESAPPFPPAPEATASPEFISEPDPNFPPAPEAADPGVESGPAFASHPVGDSEWSVPDPDRPLHPDARIEDLPPDDPFLDELRQMTGGEQPDSEDETLNRFLSDEGEKESGGGWFGRRNK